MTNFTSPRRTISATFVSAATRYWISIFPFACREIRHWEQRARLIRDSSLKGLALKALREERGNLEGAIAFAAFAPCIHRMGVARAAMAFQAAYDYADAITEQPGRGHPENTRRLHQALLVALGPDSHHLDYYAYNDGHDDGGYLVCLIDRCRSALRVLPSFGMVVHHMRNAAFRIVTYQDLNHRGPEASYRAFAEWAIAETPAGTDLNWWETGAAAGSSLAVFALMSAAAQPTLKADYVTALASAYFPWIGSLHTLLDSLIDEQEDTSTGQHSLTAYYTSREETASRLERLAAQAAHRASALPDGNQHMLILAAMVSFYLSAPQAKDRHALLATERLLTIVGDYAIPAMLVLRARHIASQVARRATDGRVRPTSQI